MPGWASGPAPEHFFKIHLVPGATLVGRTVIKGSEEPVAGVFVEGVQVEGGWHRASTRTDEEGRFRITASSRAGTASRATAESTGILQLEHHTLDGGHLARDPRRARSGVRRARPRRRQGHWRAVQGRPGHALTTRSRRSTPGRSIDPDGWTRMASVFPGTYGGGGVLLATTCRGTIIGRSRSHRPDGLPPTRGGRRGAPARAGRGGRRAAADRHEGAGVRLWDRGRHAVGRSPRARTWTGPFHPRGIEGGGVQRLGPHARRQRGERASHHGAGSGAARQDRAPLRGGHRGGRGGHGAPAHRERAGRGLGAEADVRDHARRWHLHAGWMWPFSGDYEVRARDRGPEARPAGASRTSASRRSPSRRRTRAKVRLTVEARSGVIEGRVKSTALGPPFTDAFIDSVLGVEGIAVLRYDSGRAPVLTDNGGHFALEGLADGEYGLRVYRKGSAETYADHVKVGTRATLVHQARGGCLDRGHAHCSRGAPIDRFSLSVRRQTDRVRPSGDVLQHAGGQFEIRDLPAGTYEVNARDAARACATRRSRSATASTRTGIALALVLRAPRSTGGSWTLESGVAPIAGGQLGVCRAPPSPARYEATSDPDGRFHVEGLLPGRWTLNVSSPDPGFDSVSRADRRAGRRQHHRHRRRSACLAAAFTIA